MPSHPTARVLVGLAAAAALLAPGGCGARSELLTPRVGPCTVPGMQRNCATACGTGTQQCQDGFWTPCDARASRTCRTACGEGWHTCTDGVWEPCDVPTVRECTNRCGEGTERCIDGEWTECDATAERACSNRCGTGVEVCELDAWTNCDATSVRACDGVCGPGEQVCVDGEWSSCSGPQPGPPVLGVTIRDFLDSHPDFESYDQGAETGIVGFYLGTDEKPVYAGDPETHTTHGREAFDQWYRDVPGVNLTTQMEITLSPVAGDPGMFRYASDSFFPIDDQLFGNQGRRHNYHFTLELSTRFLYSGGEVFTFRGDDDLWVFMNRRLALDLGGPHETLQGTIDLDARADVLEIEPGNAYDLHLFFAERHTVASSFSIETTIAEWANCD